MDTSNNSPKEEKSKKTNISRRTFLRTAGIIGLTGAVAGIAGCAPVGTSPTASPPTAAPANAATTMPTVIVKPTGQGGTLVVAGESIGDNYLPAAPTQGWAHTWILSNIYEGLYTTRDLKTVTPSLAVGHTVSDDGLVYTFELRQGVKFHDDTPFNAEAVEFNYMRYLDEKHPFYDANSPWRTSFLSSVKSIKAIEDYQVQFELATPKVSFPASLSTYYSGIASPTAIKKFGVLDAVRNPVGTGPFLFERGEKGNQASIAANDGYWNGRPKLDRVVIRVIPDDQSMAASLLAGEVDVTPFIDFKDIGTFRTNPNLKVEIVPAKATGYLAINQAHPTMQDLRVRQALAHALNKQQIIDVILYGQGDPAGGLVSIPNFSYAPELANVYPYDPDKAKELLQAVGSSPELALHVQSSGFWPRMGELVQADLEAVGLKTTIQKTDPATFYSQMGEGKHQIFLGDGAQQTPDPEDLFFVLFGCNNPRSKRWGYCDNKFDAVMLAQSAERDEAKRKQMQIDLQTTLVKDVVQVYNYYSRFAYVMNNRVHEYLALPVRFMYLQQTSVT